MKSYRIFLTTLALLILSGCKTTPPVIENGFLPNYEKLKTIKNDDGSYQQRWASRKLTRKIKPLQPTAFYIKPIVYYPELEYQAQFSRQAAHQLSDYLNQQIKRTVAKHFPVTNVLEPGVFVIEPAITSVRISLEDLSPLEVLPFKAVISSINYAAGGRDRDVEIRMETKVWSHDKNELIATTVFGGEGIQLENDTEQFTQAHVKGLIDQWIKDWDSNLANYKQQIQN